MDGREVRKHQLEAVANSQGGLHKLKETYRKAVGSPPGHPQVPVKHVSEMIAKILEKEFPEQ